MIRFETVAVLGAGVMGARIAAHLASAWLIWRAIGRMPPKSPMMRRTPMYAFVRKKRTAVNGNFSAGDVQRAASGRGTGAGGGTV